MNNNALHKCNSDGIYVKGPGSSPFIIKNNVTLCQNGAGIHIEEKVKAFVCSNEILINEYGICINDNSGIYVQNKVVSSHKDAICITTENPDKIA